MKKIYFTLLFAAGMQLMCASLSNAQNATLTLKVPPGAVAIDGNSKDWGDTLSFYNLEKKIHYTIANDKDKLYLVVKTNDPLQESNILGAGITFSVDTKGRKRLSFSTTFPSTGENVIGSGETLGSEPLAQKKAFAELLRFKKINVNGFREVNEDFIGVTNQYGIQVAIDYDDQGYLVYEEAIPLELFHPGDLVKSEWSFNIKLNGVQKTSVGNGRGAGSDVITSKAGGSSNGGGGRGGSRGGATPDPTISTNTSPQVTRVTSTIDFWGKFNLAKVQ